MRTLRKFFILTAIVTFILYMGINLVVNLIAGNEFYLSVFILTGFLMSMLFAAFLTFLLKPRLKYLESKEPDEPIFKDKRKKSVALKNETIEFHEIRNEIQKKWLVTYLNDKEKIIKYRMKTSLLGPFGAGAFLKFDSERNQVKIVSFPISGSYTKQGNKLAMKMIEMTENIINNK